MLPEKKRGSKWIDQRSQMEKIRNHEMSPEMRSWTDQIPTGEDQPTSRYYRKIFDVNEKGRQRKQREQKTMSYWLYGNQNYYRNDRY